MEKKKKIEKTGKCKAFQAKAKKSGAVYACAAAKHKIILLWPNMSVYRSLTQSRNGYYRSYFSLLNFCNAHIKNSF